MESEMATPSASSSSGWIPYFFRLPFS